MPQLATIQRNIADTTALLRSCEAALADEPDAIEWIQHDIKSLSKLRRQFQAEFSAAANSLWKDECRYRLFRDGDDPNLGTVTSILGEFQTLVSLVFHSLNRQTPLVRSVVDAIATANTSFQVGYSFEGSVGFVLTLPNERLVASEMTTLVDDAIGEVFALPKLMSPDAVRTVAGRFGRPVVRSCYRWAAAHVSSQIGSEAMWMRGKNVRSQMLVQYQELERLKQIIDSTSDEKTDPITVRGTLTAANVTAKTFQFSVEGSEEIRGTFDDAISESHSVTVPAVYTADLKRTSSFNYALDQETRSWFLVALNK